MSLVRLGRSARSRKRKGWLRTSRLSVVFFLGNSIGGERYLSDGVPVKE